MPNTERDWDVFWRWEHFIFGDAPPALRSRFRWYKAFLHLYENQHRWRAGGTWSGTLRGVSEDQGCRRFQRGNGLLNTRCAAGPACRLRLLRRLNPSWFFAVKRRAA